MNNNTHEFTVDDILIKKINKNNEEIYEEFMSINPLKRHYYLLKSLTDQKIAI